MGDHKTANASLEQRLLKPGQAAYDSVRAVWNGMIDRKPAAILRCQCAADVQRGIAWAAAAGLPVSIKAGGHNVAGHAVGAGSLMLDLSGMRKVTVDPAERIAWVEGGALWGDVDAATQAHGLATPGGLISETGVAGLTLSGGVGWLRSRHGLSIDNVLAAEVVTADGQLILADNQRHPDLYWALRGGGGNFGVVVRFCFALHPVGPEVMFCAPIYPASVGSAPIRFWRDFISRESDRLGSLVEFSTIPQSTDYDAAYWGQPCYTIAAVYAGDAAEGEKIVEPLRNLGTKAADFSGRMAYCDVQKLFDALFPTGQYRCYWKSHLLADLSDEMIEEGLANAIDNPSPKSISSFWNFGGATARVPADETAFGDRGFGWMYSLDSVWERKEDDAKVRDWTRAAWDRFRKHAYRKRLYLNFAGQDEDSAALTEDAFGPHLARLRKIKAAYDPGNMFRFNQNILPAKI
ncbi:MAG: FAD-binding oxidoreductase [Rhizobiales bacterium]|nr:FAD-binding oxidoreductase [Hyphomicrobiales bacterium]